MAENEIRGSRAAEPPHTAETGQKQRPAVIDPNQPFAFGIGALLLGLLLAVFIPEPTTFQRGVFTVVLGLGGAGFATAISGFLEVKSKWVTGGGSLGVFVFICIFMWQTSGTQLQKDLGSSTQQGTTTEVQSPRGGRK